MKNNRPDILLIRKYLNGELDAAAMYRLERQAQDDPLLMDMIQGMENGDRTVDEGNLLEIDQFIQTRVHNGSGKTRKLIAWKGWAAAASLVLISTIAGLWIFRTPQQNKIQDRLVKETRQIPAEKQLIDPELIVQDHRVKDALKKAPSVAPLRERNTSSLPVDAHSSLAKNLQKRKTVEGSKFPLKEAEPVIKGIPDSAVNGNLAAFDLAAKSKDAVLNEVVVIGYPREKKVETLSAAITVSGKHDSLNTALAGRVAGVKVNAAAIPRAFGNQELNEVVVTKGYGVVKKAVPAVLKPSIMGKAHPVVGWDAFKKYLKENANIPGALVSGHVTVAFMIDQNGTPVRVMVIKPLSTEADRIAVELIRNGPKWTGDAEELNKIITLKIKFR